VIFVTIGTLLPFDRLIRLVDGLAPSLPERPFFAQIGKGAYEPRNMDYARHLAPSAFGDKVRQASLIVAHAGMGSVITAMEARKPIVVFPRALELGEHTTDHQMSTVRWLSGKPGVHVAMDEAALGAVINAALSSAEGCEVMTPTAPPQFLERIRRFIADADGRGRPR